MATILISDEPEHWEGKIAANDGIVYVISPGLQSFVGPKKLAAFVAYKLGAHSEVTSEFRDLEERMLTSTLPPFDVQ